MPRDTPEITPDLLLMAYASGVFPMAESRDDPDIFWVDPERRGILPLDGFHMSRSLAKTIRQQRFHVTLDADFDGVLKGCADRDETWINPSIAGLYRALHRGGHAHSLEVWDGRSLAGGVYGVTMGGAFFGESMFSRRRDASKVALAYLVTLLRARDFLLFDTQFLTDHLIRLGAIEIPRLQYQAKLRNALGHPAQLTGPVPDYPEVMHLRSHTS
ncbi:MAG: leucyl/phenylalanyl-tRNA--protein transferase [Pseudomonadota bacterium]